MFNGEMMKATEALNSLWVDGYFEEHKSTGEVRYKLKEEYGLNPSNTTMSLKSCAVFVRRERGGWIQRARYVGPISNNNHSEPSSELILFVNDLRLINSCKSDFDNGNYWDAVFKALRHLEVRTRSKAKLSTSEHGADLMEKAFRPNAGVLKIPTCATEGEQDGFKQIMKGMMMFHRNAKGHREGIIDKRLALKIISYTDYLLTIIETSSLR
ncbi:MAG TPA: TIGR02391 family protein [Candidatus Nanoarchaeia archaeon]|nr:TIGR02391 family protein [Candidatus Nanoarchaeia archaeon]